MSTPIKRLLSGSAVYGLGSVLVQLVTIILMPLLTAHLAPREYGAIALLNFTSLFLIAIFSLGLSTSIGLCYFDQKEEEWRSGVVFSAFVMLLFSGAALLACGYLTLDLWTEYLLTSREFGSAALYMLAAAALSMITFPFDTKLRLDERP
ncbi:MAG: hypothetical protein J5J00_12395, partial [Deltaproteobacteria bacterium]|nr:hypothetical protein [Deltaproteobacteria bacterium]